jgi:opacity protein-like surface antigen
VAWPWSSNWIVRAEYLYYNLTGTTGTGIVAGTPLVGAFPAWNNMSISSARDGLGYKF